MRLLGRALVQSNWCLQKMRKCGHRKDGHLQATEKGFRRNPPGCHFNLGIPNLLRCKKMIFFLNLSNSVGGSLLWQPEQTIHDTGPLLHINPVFYHNLNHKAFDWGQGLSQSACQMQESQPHATPLAAPKTSVKARQALLVPGSGLAFHPSTSGCRLGRREDDTQIITIAAAKAFSVNGQYESVLKKKKVSKVFSIMN